jgi:hypothetical protein
MKNKLDDGVLGELPDYLAWKSDKENFDLIDYLMCVGTPDSLLAMLELVKPSLVEVDGYLFIEHGFTEEIYKKWLERLSDIRDVQRVMNHFHISSFLQGQVVSDEVAVLLANKVAGIWSILFKSEGLIAEASGYDLETAQVTLVKKT